MVLWTSHQYSTYVILLNLKQTGIVILLRQWRQSEYQMFDSTDYCICEIVVLEFYLQKRSSFQWHKQAVTDAIMLSGIYLKIILKLFEYVVDMKQIAYDWQL